MKTCLNPNKNNPQFCADFEPPDVCQKKGFCDWQKGMDLKSARERMTRGTREVINP